MSQLKMNLQYFAGEKTEKATPKKKQEARRKGQVAKSAELPSSLIFLFIFISFYILGSYFGERLLMIYHKILYQYISWEVTSSNLQLIMLELLTDIMWIMIPIFLVTAIAATIGNLMQVGFLFTGEPIKFKLEHLDPIKGFKRIFSKRALVELLKSIFKIIIVSYVTFSVVWNQKDVLFQFSHMQLGDILAAIGKLIFEIGIRAAVLLIILSVLDYLYQKYEHEKNLRMSKQDIKDEYKKTEGDPLIKSKIKERQRQMAMSRMMQAVPEADVVITNPTHFAVAIKYKPEEMEAPQVIAKGQDHIALKIKELAKENNIVTVENKWLARAIFAQVEIGEAVPAELYQAVAEVLAYVYKIKGLVRS